MKHTPSGIVRAYWPAALTLLAGLVISLLFYRLLRVRDEQTAKFDFADQAKTYISAIEKVVDANIDAVRWTAATLAIPVAPGEGVYNRRLPPFSSERYDTLTLIWAPAVPPDERASFVRQAQTLHEHFAIQNQVREGDSYPIRAVNGVKNHDDVLGYDFAADPHLRKYLDYARESDKIFVVSNCARMKESLGPTTVLVVTAVRERNSELPTSMPEAGRFIGYAIGAFQVKDVVDVALTRLDQKRVNLHIFDAFALDGEKALYHRPAENNEASVAEGEVLTEDRMNYTGEIELATTRRWRFVCTPTQAYLSEAYTWQPLLGLLAGLSLTAVAFEHFLSQIRQRRKAEALVLRRTAELQRTNERLSTEIAARKQFEAERDELLDLLEHSNESLQQLNRQLAISNNDLQDFAVIASHDLKEPLRKVRVLAEQLHRQLGEGPSGRAEEYLELIEASTERMQRLITNILQVSRVTTHGSPFVWVDLTRIARDVVGDLAVRIDETGGSVDIEPLPVIEADPLQMRQLLQNLIDNGLKYGRDGEQPRVRVYSSKPAAGAAPGERCAIHVHDDGPGIDAADADRIFALFQRVHDEGSREGSGVGLAVCRKIAERHGGSIDVESVAGGGTRFTVVLPIAQEQDAQAVDSREEAPAAL